MLRILTAFKCSAHAYQRCGLDSENSFSNKPIISFMRIFVYSSRCPNGILMPPSSLGYGLTVRLCESSNISDPSQAPSITILEPFQDTRNFLRNRDNIFPQNTVCLCQRVTHTEVELKPKSNLPMALCNGEMYSELKGSVGTSPVCFVPQAISSQL